MIRLLFAAAISLGLGAVALAQSQFVVPPNAPATPSRSVAAESTRILKAAPGTLIAVYATTASAGYLMTFNQTTAPTNGAVTPINCVRTSADTTIGLDFAPQPPEYYSTGIVAAFSTTGCFTLTLTPVFFHALVQ